MAGFFFVGDLIRLAPLSTPAALMWKLSLRELPQDGGGSNLGLAAASDVASWASLGGGLAALTILHLLTFALLAVAAVACFERLHVPMHAATGAVWGLVVYSLVFELGMVAVHPNLVADVPGFWSVAGANLLAGAVMGGYLQLGAPRRESSKA